MSIGPEDVGKHHSIYGVSLCSGNPVSVSVSVHHLRVYRVEGVVVVEDKFSQRA